jgi:hypothetical protein
MRLTTWLGGRALPRLPREATREPLRGWRVWRVVDSPHRRVSCWGHVVRHTLGWRSQFAYPYDLYLLSTRLSRR